MPGDKRMRLRFAGHRRLCGTHLPARTLAIYEPLTRTVRCVECPGAPANVGVAGSSARREYERRKASDEQRLRQRWGKLGGLAVALSDEKQSTTAWATGAVGEEKLGARLDSASGESVAVLHDRRIPGTRTNIDHIVVTTGGVWVIDAKRYKGRPELRVEGGILRPRVERLIVGRRDCNALVDSALDQAAVVRDLVGDLRVVSALCFVDADWPLVGGAFSTRGVHVLWPKRLVKLLRDDLPPEAPLATADVAGVRGLLAAALPPA